MAFRVAREAGFGTEGDLRFASARRRRALPRQPLLAAGDWRDLRPGDPAMSGWRSAPNREPSGNARDSTRRRALPVAGLPVAVLLAVTSGCAGVASSEPPASTPSATPSVAPSIEADPFPYSEDPLPIEPGTYLIPESAWSVADLTVTFPEDWTVQYGHVFAKNPDTPDEFGFYAVVVDEIYADACVGDAGELVPVGPSVDDLAQALLEQPGPEGSGPIATTLGGYPASRVDLAIPQSLDLEACNLGGIGLQVWYSPPADKYFVLGPDGTMRVYILDVEGMRQVVLTAGSATLDADAAELQTVLDSIEIEP